MNLLLLPYIANIIILIPVGFGTLFNLFPISGGYFSESVGWRTIVGSVWTAILIGSFLGLRSPTIYSPLLLIQVIYKSLWIGVYVIPRLNNPNEVHWGIAITFILIIISYPFVIPWSYLFRI
jgi:hypothetical protein